MKSLRLFIGGFILIFLVFAAIWLFRFGIQPVRQIVESSAVSQQGQSPEPSNLTSSNSVSPPSILENTRVKAFQAARDEENSKSMDFYGKIIDQHGDPVTEAEVKAGIGLYVSFERSGGYWNFTKSDSEGKFSFVGVRGAGMGLFFKKEGFVYDRNASRPNDYVPDPLHPMVFTMWKFKGPEQMVKSEFSSALPVDGTMMNFDFMTARKVEGKGTLVIRVTRTPMDIVGNKPYEWTATLQIPGGGFIETQDIYPYEAPAEGYQSTLTFNRSVSPFNTEGRGFTKLFYFKMQEGYYGRMLLDLAASVETPPQGGVRIQAYINPFGSRNLEVNPNKVVRGARINQIGLKRALSE